MSQFHLQNICKSCEKKKKKFKPTDSVILEVLVNQDRKESKGEKTTPWMCADVRSTRSPHQLRQKRLKFS